MNVIVYYVNDKNELQKFITNKAEIVEVNMGNKTQYLSATSPSWEAPKK